MVSKPSVVFGHELQDAGLFSKPFLLIVKLLLASK